MATYERKQKTVEAVCIPQSMVIETAAGKKHAQAGDFIVIDGDRLEIYTEERFKDEFQRVQQLANVAFMPRPPVAASNGLDSAYRGITAEDG